VRCITVRTDSMRMVRVSTNAELGRKIAIFPQKPKLTTGWGRVKSSASVLPVCCGVQLAKFVWEGAACVEEGATCVEEGAACVEEGAASVEEGAACVEEGAACV
jgi:hypothetical protein